MKLSDLTEICAIATEGEQIGKRAVIEDLTTLVEILEASNKQLLDVDECITQIQDIITKHK